MRFTDEEIEKIMRYGKKNCYDEIDAPAKRSQSICMDIYRRFFREYMYMVISHKLLIAGSRGITDIDISKYIPDGVELIISGGANGVDTLAEQYADRHRISKMIIRPDYKAYGKKAPLIRNKAMVDMCDEVLVFWDGKSRGTKYTIDCAKEKKKEITVININKEWY